VSVVANVVELKPPVAEKIETPWTFRAACHLKEPLSFLGVLRFGVILDLGFGIYRQIQAHLFGVIVVAGKFHLAESFAANWAENGQPNDLIVTTIERGDLGWAVHVERRELDQALKVTHLSSLADALVEQGLCTQVELDS